MYLPPELKEDYIIWCHDQLGFDFHDTDLLITAFTHRSYVNEHRKSADDHNERLEFLGDAILELVVSDYLYRNFDKPEGTMTAWRSALVRTESIGQAGEMLGYEPLIRMSKGERQNTNRSHAHILANCFEALIGAIYLDQGFTPARDLIYEYIISRIDTVIGNDQWRDTKTYLQEFSQKVEGLTPQYHTIKAEGPDHDRTFTVELHVGKNVRGRGIGHSKQEAQNMAARQGIEYYKTVLTPQEIADFEAELQ